MSTDVDAGKIVRIRSRWEGLPPAIGDFLMSDHRPRGAYRIVEIDYVGQHATGDTFSFVIERVSVEVARHATSTSGKIHSLRWDPRSPKSSKIKVGVR